MVIQELIYVCMQWRGKFSLCKSLNVLNNYMILNAFPEATRITGTFAAPCKLYEYVFLVHSLLWAELPGMAAPGMGALWHPLQRVNFHPSNKT